MFVYDWLLETATSDQAHHFRFDLEKRRLQFKDATIIEGGGLVTSSIQMPDGTTTSFTGLIAFSGDAFMEIEKLYAQFKRSVPSKREQLNKGNFKAYSSDKLSFEELETNAPRQIARALLEGFIIIAASAGLIRWKNPAHFFWQGTDPDLILYRNWII